MQTIKKFKIDQKYYPKENRNHFRIVERNGKELKVARIRKNDREYFTITTSLTADEKGAYEYFLYDGLHIPATNVVNVRRRAS